MRLENFTVTGIENRSIMSVSTNLPQDSGVGGGETVVPALCLQSEDPTMLRDAEEKKSLKMLHAFLTGKADFSSLHAFSLRVKNTHKNIGKLASYFLGKTEIGTRFTFQIQIPKEFIDYDLDEIYVTPNSHETKSGAKYSWLDLSFDNDREGKREVFVSCRMKPEESVNKIDFLHWRGIGEQLLADYLMQRNDIQFNELIPFTVDLEKSSKTYHHTIAGEKGLPIDLTNNPMLPKCESLLFVPKQDEEEIYQWLDVSTFHAYLPEDEAKAVVSYRLFPEEQRLASQEWYGFERQLFVDLLEGKQNIRFTQLKPIYATVPPRGNEVDLFRSRKSKAYFSVYFPRKLFIKGEIVAVPQQDDQLIYQWFDAYQVDSETREPVGALLASTRLYDGKPVVSGWKGPEIQLLRDFSEGKVHFDNLRPITLTVGTILQANLWTNAEKRKVYFNPIQAFGLSSGDTYSLIPVRQVNEEDVEFHVIIGGQIASTYIFNKTQQKFFFVEIANDFKQQRDAAKESKPLLSPDDATDALLKYIQEDEV